MGRAAADPSLDGGASTGFCHHLERGGYPHLQGSPGCQCHHL